MRFTNRRLFVGALLIIAILAFVYRIAWILWTKNLREEAADRLGYWELFLISVAIVIAIAVAAVLVSWGKRLLLGGHSD